MRRHPRQIRLAEVGATGQARIACASVNVGLDDFAGEVAVRYLAGAGVARLRVRDESLALAASEIDPGVTCHVDPVLVGGDAHEDTHDDFGLAEPAARELARGAGFALRALKSLLEGPA